MIRIGVTGANGYFGKRIIKNLIGRKLDVIPIVHSKSRSNEIECDLTCSQSVHSNIRPKDIDALIHCAAIVPKSKKDYDDTKVYEQNIQMLENLCQIEFKRLVFCSSVSVYGFESQGMSHENMITKCGKGYAKSKIECEKYLYNHCEVEYVISRVPGLFGAGRSSGLIYTLISSLLVNRLPELDNSPPAWSAIHVDDAAELVSRLVLSIVPDRLICNIGYGVPQSVVRLIGELMAIMNIDEFVFPDIPDNWVCHNIDRQLRNIGHLRTTWYQRLAEEVDIIRGSM